MVEVFKGVEQADAYYRTVQAVEGGVISPGGGAALIRMSRQGVLDLAWKSQHIRGWAYYRGFAKQVDYFEISVRDLVRHGVLTGRIASVEDCGISFPSLAREIATAQEEKNLQKDLRIAGQAR